MNARGGGGGDGPDGGGHGGVEAWNPTFGNPPWEQATPRLLIVRLSPFAVAERSSTHLLLAFESRRGAPAAYVDFLFAPARGLPRSLHAGRSPREFDALLVSNSYLLELLNVAPLLEQSGIAAAAHLRGEEEPLVVLGGANAMAAHALLEPAADGGAIGRGWASAVDAFFFGEGEGRVRRLAAVLAASRGLPRRELLGRLAASVEGLWVPPAPGEGPAPPSRKARYEPSTADLVPTVYPVLDGEEASTARLQITAGCPALCSFCFESWDRRPFREVPLATLVDAARALKRSTGARRLDLFSFNFSYHSAFPSLVRELSALFAEVSFMSQRVDVLARDPELLPFQIAAGKRSYTLGIEGVSARLRDFLQKGVSTADIEAVVLDLVRRQVREVKLFYIVTGYEEAADLTELGAFLGKVARERSSSGAPRIVISYTWLLRMPFTPLMHDPPLFDRGRAERIGRYLEGAAVQRGFEARLAGRWEEHVTCQLLAAGGHAGRSLLRELAAAGARYEGAFPVRAWPVVEAWMKRNAAVVEAAVRAAEPAGGRPFRFVEGAPEAEVLERRYCAAAAALNAPASAPLSRSPLVREGLDIEGTAALLRERDRAVREAALVVVELGPQTAPAGAAWREAWLARELYAAEAELVEQVLAVELVPPAAGEPWDFPWHGKALARIASWDAPALLGLARAGLRPLVRPAPPGGCVGMEARLVVAGCSLARARSALEGYLASVHCRVETRREGEGYRLAAAAGAVKRRGFAAALLRPEGTGVEARLTLGPRLDLSGLVRALGSSVTVEVLDLSD